MSSAGHVLDMIARINKNRALREKTRNRYQKVKEAYEKHSSTHHSLIDRTKLSTMESRELRKKIRMNLIQDNRKILLKQIFLLFFLSTVLFFVLYIILN